MLDYVIVSLVVFAANAIPAFAPPTWSLLVFFELNFDLRAPLLVVLGVVSATLGRWLLATYMRHSTRWMPARYVDNMTSAGAALMRTRGRTWATFALFFASPLSSAQLFVAAGIMKTVRLRPLLIAFVLGRVITYSTYVTGAHFAKGSSIGDVLLDTLRSPWAIAAQLGMIVLIVLPGLRHWNHGDSHEKTSKE